MPLVSRDKPVGTRVVAWGHYQPETVKTNADLVAGGLDSDDDWIRTRTGIVERHLAAEETLVDLAERAARDVLAKSSLEPADIGLVIFATCTARFPIPIGAAEIAARLGIDSPGAFDLNAACAGFVYALNAASNAVLTGQASAVLVVCAEKFSDWVDWTDRSTAILFADGAGAVIVSASDTVGIGPVVWGSDGDNSQVIRIDPETRMITQEGQTVYRWATSQIGPVALRTCAESGVDPSELAVFAPHQANLRIVEALAKKLGADSAIIARDVVTSGNTSAASIPMAMSKLLLEHQVPSGAPMLVLGFGAGLTYAGQVLLSP
ncbi:MAG: 3-oxoacyl-ACP synthase [Frankiales bacterium]|jgi:3-oxoacyl-[acyl-carrier-protein] synthase-3|nr:3-oxoacyl-ACP synthase [Frankiales bacterium]